MFNIMLREFLKNYRRTGTIIPSSKFLIKKMLAPIDFKNATCIVELGTGDGCLTKALLARMHPSSKLLAFEQNQEIFKTLNKLQDPRLRKINDSAEHIQKHLQLHDLEKADYILSGLPLVFLPAAERTSIIHQVKESMHPDATFIQFQYSLKSLKEFRHKFSKVNIQFTPWNLPPAFVYSCTL